MPEPTRIQPYKEWRDAFDNEKVFTRRDMANALHEKERAFEKAAAILGVKRILPNNYSCMMQIQRVHRTESGIYIVVI
jgi:hypothetical protein